MIGAALGGLVALATGVLVVQLLMRSALGKDHNQVITTVCLGLAVGILLTACTHFFWQEVGSSAPHTFLWVDVGLVLALGFAFRRQGAADLPARANARARSPFALLLLSAAAVAATLDASSFALDQLTGRAVQWDALAIWNLKAIFLLRAGPHWSDALDRALLSSHPDYPLLLPLTIARLWRYAGRSEAALVPFAIAATFSAACVMLLGAGVAQVRGQAQGALAALALLAMPYFFEVGAWQYADIPLAFFELSTLLCLMLAYREEETSGARSDRAKGAWTVAGLCAGAALWTKNEGAIFVAAFLVAVVAVGLWRGPSRRVLTRVSRIGLGLLPAVVTLITFKVRHPFSNDIFGNLNSATVRRLFDLEWHQALWFHLKQAAFSSSDRLPMLLVLGYSVVSLLRVRRDDSISLPSSNRVAWAVSALSLVLLALGLYSVYLISPHAIAWQVANSAERLRLQLLPSTLFVIFVYLPPAEKVLGESQTAHRASRERPPANSCGTPVA